MKMKRKYRILLPLAGMILICLIGCNKDEEHPGSGKDSSNLLVYEDASLMDQVSPYFYDNHIYRIELLGANQEREDIVREARANGVEKDELLIEEARKFFFNHTGVIMYSIPTLDPEQTLIVYESKGLYQVTMAHFRPAENGRMAFSLKTMDDCSYFSMKLDDQNRIGELDVFENEQLQSFNSAVYSIAVKEENGDETLKGTSASCCRKEGSWSDCMECTSNDCQGSWLCKVVAVIAPVELIAGFAVSCIGAGPDSIC